jgi:hypothetical protein
MSLGWLFCLCVTIFVICHWWLGLSGCWLTQMLHERTKLPSLSIGLDERTKTNYLFPFSLREQIRGQKPIIFSVQNPETWKIYNHLPIRSTTTHNRRSITRSNHNNINKQRRPHRRRLRKRSVQEREGTRWRQRHCLMFDSFCFSTYTWNWMLICCIDVNFRANCVVDNNGFFFYLQL